jgi:hypothetical protein
MHAYMHDESSFCRDMQAIAPNLTVLVGELVGARLIAHAGTLINLAKAPASTVQILGAEKALFRALKTKHATPKYGLLFHASLIGQASPKNKGKIARVLAAKCALAIRVDALGETTEAQIGLDSRTKVRLVCCACSSFIEQVVNLLYHGLCRQAWHAFIAHAFRNHALQSCTAGLPEVCMATSPIVVLCVRTLHCTCFGTKDENYAFTVSERTCGLIQTLTSEVP